MPRDTSFRWFGVRWEILKRDNFTCQYCGQFAPNVQLHVDHVTAIADGGSNQDDNLITACSACNVGKEAFRARLVGRASMIVGLNPRHELQREKIAAYLGEVGKATATEISKALNINRPNTSASLNQSNLFVKIEKRGRDVFYGLATL